MEFALKRIHGEKRKYFLIIALTAALTITISKNYNIDINVSGSLKQTFIITRKTSKLQTSKLVKLPLPLKVSDHKKGTLIVKRLACMPPSITSTRHHQYFCDDRLIATKDNPKYKTINGIGYFVVGETNTSIDSRFFGFIDPLTILGVQP